MINEELKQIIARDKKDQLRACGLCSSTPGCNIDCPCCTLTLDRARLLEALDEEKKSGARCLSALNETATKEIDELKTENEKLREIICKAGLAVELARNGLMKGMGGNEF